MKTRSTDEQTGVERIERVRMKRTKYDNSAYHERVRAEKSAADERRRATLAQLEQRFPGLLDALVELGLIPEARARAAGLQRGGGR